MVLLVSLQNKKSTLASVKNHVIFSGRNFLILILFNLNISIYILKIINMFINVYICEVLLVRMVKKMYLQKRKLMSGFLKIKLSIFYIILEAMVEKIHFIKK